MNIAVFMISLWIILFFALALRLLSFALPLQPVDVPLPSHTTLIHERVSAARRGENPAVLCRMRSGWAVLGDVQRFRGYALLLGDPIVADLNALDQDDRVTFLRDMSLLGDAILRSADNVTHINYELLGNKDRALHAHLFPRSSSTEQPQLASGPVWHYPREQRNSPKLDVFGKHATLLRDLRAELEATSACL